MVAVASLIIILVASMVVNRVAAVALQLTGLSQEVARFQARSAFSGAGFTTTEAEQIVGHPVRRRIVMMLMLIGNVGIVSVLGSVTLSFVTIDDPSRAWVTWTSMGGGGLAVLLVSRSRLIDRSLCRVIAWALTRWTDLDARDYANLLHLQEGYGVLEKRIGDRLSGKTIEAAGLASAGIVVLGVVGRQGGYEGAPAAERVLQAGERLYLYGEARTIHELSDALRSG